MDTDIVSKAVMDTFNVFYARPPYTRGKDEACIELTTRLVQDLPIIDRGGAESIRAANFLREQMDSARTELVVEDIESVMCTVKDILTDAAWDKFSLLFLKFLRGDYCKDFFEKVCKPVKKIVTKWPADVLFTDYQILFGRRTQFAYAIKTITRKVDTSEMLKKRSFIRFYGHNNDVKTMENVIDGLIIRYLFEVQANTA